MPKLRLGCVADDFTGASDMASFLVKGGLNTEMIDGVPDKNWHPAPETQAVVIALKSRTAPVADAVKQSLASFQWLRNQADNCQLFFKYCSTFDSTEQGNIGPVIDAVLQAFDLHTALVSPALPVNGRTVYRGHLFVNGQQLSDSSMRFHPLTPMRESNLCSLMECQGQHQAVNLPHTIIEQGEPAIRAWLQQLTTDQCYLVADHFNDRHADSLAQAFSDQPFLSGSSGLAEMLARQHGRNNSETGELSLTAPGRALVLAGSCSEATRGQVAYFLKHFPGRRMDPARLVSGEETVDHIWQWLLEQGDQPCLLYSSDTPEQVSQAQSRLGHKISDLLESVFSELAQRARSAGFGRLIVAGGETSGAVTQALDLRSFRVGPSVAPGVPVIQPLAQPDLLLVLKSGNFGDEQFFTKAIQLTEAGMTG
ncbi:3-oxo-tetronate kinase [Aestuariirhabdus haliotis]|uniref:3-oxo-tetronate kinase n=1 Tax=Aestuariirhabdus haliotis TaxID=2918751 RepID=UPI0020BFC71A|nr:3-oxo-tetronate kinase [Aestuariirhabdus haliotis]MCL6420138.1 four-carbon acid sugar kinase family protein [Aestuariirhabdus haliotis]